MAGAPGGMPRIEIEGGDATEDQLGAGALDAYGHFTAMQVRDRRARGLGLHLARLDAANRDLFGAGLDPALIRDRIRHALGGETRDASVRVYVRESPGGSSVMVTVRPPGGMPAAPWRLHAVPYQRPVAHIKHMGDFGQGYFRRLARRNAFDEALLTGPDALITAPSTTTLRFFNPN